MEDGTKCRTLDDVSVILASQSDKPPSSFPPTEDAFKQHEGIMEIVMRTKAAAPDELRDLTNLYCTDSECCIASCHCVSSGLSCMELWFILS